MGLSCSSTKTQISTTAKRAGGAALCLLLSLLLSMNLSACNVHPNQNTQDPSYYSALNPAQNGEKNLILNGIFVLDPETRTGESISIRIDGSVSSIAKHPTGGTLVGGRFQIPKQLYRNLIKLDDSNHLDPLFSQRVLGINAEVTAIAFSKKHMYFGGKFTEIQGIPAGRIARTDMNGNLDADWISTTGQGFDGEVNAINIQPDGKILVSGNFTSFNYKKVIRNVRINENGTIDDSYGKAVSLTLPALPREAL